MKGRYQIEISNKRIRYKITLNRNITVIQGDSATGKTTLVKLLSDYNEEGKASGVKLNCEKNCEVLKGKDWEYKLSQIQDSIIFIDEGNKFVTSNDFARAIQNSDNYFVIITREDLHSLPYSVNEIYGLKQVGNTKIGEQVYNSSYRIYEQYSTERIIKPSRIITEDSNAGFAFLVRYASN